MADNFDPYLKWLGIRNGGPKLHYYRLLGLELFESDGGVIADAADRQISHVQRGAEEHPAESKQLIEHLKAARNCLLTAASKNEYDRKLKKAIQRRREQKLSESGRILPPEAPSTQPPSEEETIKVVVAGNINNPVEDQGFIVTDSGQDNSGNPYVMPGIKTSAPRKRGGSNEWVGWVMGAVGAVIFAYIILYTDLIDRVRGTNQAAQPTQQNIQHDDTEPASEDSQPPDNPIDTPTQRPRRPNRNPTRQRDRDQRVASNFPDSRNSNNKRTDEPNVRSTNPDRRPSSDLKPDLNRNNLPDRTPINRGPVTAIPIPEAGLVEAASKQVEDEIKSKLASRSETIFSTCLLYTSPSPRDQRGSRMPSSA